MRIKQPLMLDSSYWEEIPDFSKVYPVPFLVSTKATEGGLIVDPKFFQYWADLKQDGIYRSAYHFFRKASNSAAQAQIFINTVRAGGVEPKDIFELDVEEDPPPSATQIIAWLDVVEAQFSNLIIIYGRKNVLDKIVMTATQKARLRTYPIWMAWYPDHPDLFDEPPSTYIPDQSKWGEVWCWQYSVNGILQGIQGGVDLDWVSPKLVSYLVGANMTHYGTVTTTSYINIRKGPGTNYEDVGNLYDGYKLEASEIKDGWWHLSKINGNAAVEPSWSSGAYITENAPPVVTPPDESKLDAILAGVNKSLEEHAKMAGAMAEALERESQMMGLLDAILAAVNSTTEPPAPTPESDGYTGAVIGKYRIKDDGEKTRWMEVLDSDGNSETVLMDDSYNWLTVNCPGFPAFEKMDNPPVWFDPETELWHIKLRVYKGELVRVVQIVHKRAQIVGIDAAGLSRLCATNLDALKPVSDFPYYFHKVPNVARYFPLVQPRTQKGHVDNAIWIPIENLEEA